MERFKPHSYKDNDEYWITMEDFQCHFGGLIICTSCEPFQIEGFNVDRMYLISKDAQCKSKQNPNEKQKSQAYIDHKENHTVYQSHRSAYKKPNQNFSDSCTAKRGIEINVHENGRTIKVDNTSNVPNGKYVKPTVVYEKKEFDSSQNVEILFSQKQNIRNWRAASRYRGCPTTHVRSDTGNDSANDERIKHKRVQSDVSIQPESESTFSTSDISINVRENAANPQTSVRRQSVPTNCNGKKHVLATGYTKINFMATRTDHFQSHGSSKPIVEYFGKWKRQ